MKKWKKTHRYRRKARMSYVNITLEPSVLQYLKEYCKKCNISLTTGVHRCLRKAMDKYKEVYEN